MINLELPKITKSESEPEPKKVEQAQPAPVEPAKVEPVAEAATPPTPDKKKKDKKAKSKKLLMTGVGALVILFGGGLASYQLTSTPKVDEKLVNEYMKQSVESQVLGIESQSKVPDGIVADKNSTASFDETKWAEYNDPIFGITLDYPANVTERLHSSNSITFLRKDSYLFKITYYSTDEDLEEFWSKTKDKGISYSAEPAEFKGKPALLLKLQEKIEYPGDRYLVKTEEKIYDIWFATDSNAYASDDVDRAEKMLENLRFI